MAWDLCDCGRGYYDPTEHSTCYECFQDRQAEYASCIWCGRWHSPRFATCFKCRSVAGREDAGARLRLDILIRDEFTCRYCGTREGLLHVDHVKPCARGGTADPWNLQTLCAECNRWKGASWSPGSRHDDARIRLVHMYFTFGWCLLDGEQRTRLNEHADDYGSLFDFRARRRPYLDARRAAA